jgi:hypothetical protein
VKLPTSHMRLLHTLREVCSEFQMRNSATVELDGGELVREEVHQLLTRRVAPRRGVSACAQIAARVVQQHPITWVVSIVYALSQLQRCQRRAGVVCKGVVDGGLVHDRSGAVELLMWRIWGLRRLKGWWRRSKGWTGCSSGRWVQVRCKGEGRSREDGRDEVLSETTRVAKSSCVVFAHPEW